MWFPPQTSRTPSGRLKGYGRFCTRSCASRWKMRGRDQSGALNPAWTGARGKPTAGRARARLLYPDLGTCEGCGDAPAVERHHRDGDPLNNARGNVAFLCDSCHTRFHLTRTHCKRGHPFDAANTHVKATGARVSRACAALYQRLRRARLAATR